MSAQETSPGLPVLPSYLSCFAAGFLACSLEVLLFQLYPGLGLTLSKASSFPVLILVFLLWAGSAFLGVKVFQTGLFLFARRELPTVVVFGFTALGFFVAYLALSLLYGFLSDSVSFFDSGGLLFLVSKDVFLAALAAAISAYGLRIYPGASPARGSWLRLWRPFYEGLDTSPPEGLDYDRDRLADVAKRRAGINR